MPAQAGIQYAEAVEDNQRRRGILDHPLSRVMTEGLRKTDSISGIAKRSVCARAAHVDAVKPVNRQGRGAAVGTCSLTVDLSRACRAGRAAPVQRLVLEFGFLSPSVITRKAGDPVFRGRR